MVAAEEEVADVTTGDHAVATVAAVVAVVVAEVENRSSMKKLSQPSEVVAPAKAAP